MKIVLLLEDLLLGGTQTQALQLSHGFIQSGHSAALWTLTSGDQLADVAHQRNIPVKILGKKKSVTPAVLLRLAKELRTAKPDILLLLTVLPNIWGRIVGKLCFQPMIIGACRGGGAPFRQHEKFLWPLARHVICNTRALQNVLHSQLRVPLERTSVIYNGIDTDLFHPSETHPEHPTVLHVGRLVPDKNQDMLVRAFAQTLKSVPNARLIIVGDGPRHDALHDLAREIIPADSFSFVPGTTNIAPLYKQGTVFAISSAREGLPNVVLEAMSSGLPVVGTAVGGIPELVANNKTGYLVPPDALSQFSEKLAFLLQHTDTAQAFGITGRHHIQNNFSLSSSLNAHLSLFSSFLA